MTGGLPLAHRARPRRRCSPRSASRLDRRPLRADPRGRALRPRARRPAGAARGSSSSGTSRSSPRRTPHTARELLVPRRRASTTTTSPAIVDTFLSRGEFLTAYTPYQPEMSQGVLQAIFEYQTAICELTGMDVSNASGYDGVTVAADACFIAQPRDTGRTTRRARRDAQPAGAPGREDLRAGLRPRGRRGPARAAATTDPARSRRRPSTRAAVLFPQPNFFGCLEDAPALAAAAARRRRARRRARRPRPRSACSRRPATYGCDDGDRRGAVGRQRPELRRAALRLPRLAHRVHPPDAGSDRRRDDRPRTAKRGFVLTLQTREQHIRREKATSNMTTNQTLLALGGSRHAVLARPGGPPRAGRDLHRARRVREGADRAARRLRASALQGGRVPHADPRA